MFQRAFEGSTDMNDDRTIDTLEPAFTPAFLAQLDQLLQMQRETDVGDAIWASVLLGQWNRLPAQHNLVVVSAV